MLTHFRLGGFNLPLRQRADGSTETVRLIRAFNVLRQYEESEVPAAWSMLAHSLLPGGLLVEGTSEPFGRLWVANLLRKPVQGRRRARPAHAEDQTPIRCSMRDWCSAPIFAWALIRPTSKQCCLKISFIAWCLVSRSTTSSRLGNEPRETAPMRAWGLRQWFIASAERLLLDGYDLLMQRKFLSRGYLLWRFGSHRTTP